LETDDPKSILRTTSLFAPYLIYTVTPVVEMSEAAEAGAVAMQLRSANPITE
jgi:hypothetical protein